jgi:hypothetical protein
MILCIHLDSDPSCPVTPLGVQESTAPRIVLAPTLPGSKTFTCFFFALLQNVLNDFDVIACAKHGVQFLL